MSAEAVNTADGILTLKIAGKTGVVGRQTLI